jgi:predicted PhzF superfamily epimerase YddE/YHI9
MRIPIYKLDAFTGRVFHGNPAAVCPLAAWLPDETMQGIAAENNLSETAFFVDGKGGYEIRWFTPKQEVDLCGHATLASGHVVLNLLKPGLPAVKFQSKSGPLRVAKAGELLALDFPTRAPSRCPLPHGLGEGLGKTPQATLVSRDVLAVYESEAQVRALEPDFDKLSKVNVFAVIATAPGDEADFVSRFFAPRVGVPEDAVTGSSHCSLIPYWAKRLGKKRLRALQVSPRGGELYCELKGERVSIAGKAVLYLEGTIEV